MDWTVMVSRDILDALMICRRNFNLRGRDALVVVEFQVVGPTRRPTPPAFDQTKQPYPRMTHHQIQDLGLNNLSHKLSSQVIAVFDEANASFSENQTLLSVSRRGRPRIFVVTV
jgi:hypothetical protein